MQADGQLQFLGRIDRQVKIDGIRVEPGEVEAALGRHPLVRLAAVVPVRTAAGAQRLAGLVQPLPGTSVDPERLRHWLEARLPRALVPVRLAVCDALPLTAAGKLDTGAVARALAREIAAAPPSGRAPQDPLEALIAETWADTLGLPRVPTDQPFLQIGGNSLLAATLAERAR